MSQNDTVAMPVGVVIGSTRPTRICGVVADWLVDAVQPASDLTYQLIDLAAINLPLLDEPLKPDLGHYEYEHTKTWSRLVMSFAGFVFVFPQYNWGYPAPLKNALDCLYGEWADRPAGLVTYGTHGGHKAAAQLTSVLQGLHMRTLNHNVELDISANDMDASWQLADPAATLKPFHDAAIAMDRDLSHALATGSTGPG